MDVGKELIENWDNLPGPIVAVVAIMVLAAVLTRYVKQIVETSTARSAHGAERGFLEVASCEVVLVGGSAALKLDVRNIGGKPIRGVALVARHRPAGRDVVANGRRMLDAIVVDQRLPVDIPLADTAQEATDLVSGGVGLEITYFDHSDNRQIESRTYADGTGPRDLVSFSSRVSGWAMA